MSEKQLLSLLNPGKSRLEYQEAYDKLLTSCKPRGINKTGLSYYTEKHHILPRCLGGDDKDSNYVLLTALEHLVAHTLLYFMYPENLSIANAINLMINSGKLDPKLVIDTIDFTNIAEIKEKASKLSNRPVVCYGVFDTQVHKVYASRTEVIEDGFNRRYITYMISEDPARNLLTSKGCRFMDLEKFKELYPEDTDDYYRRVEKLGKHPDIDKDRLKEISKSLIVLRNLRNNSSNTSVVKLLIKDWIPVELFPSAVKAMKDIDTYKDLGDSRRFRSRLNKEGFVLSHCLSFVYILHKDYKEITKDEKRKQELQSRINAEEEVRIRKQPLQG